MDASIWYAEAVAGQSARTAVEKSRRKPSHITRHENRNEALALALQLRGSFSPMRSNELKVDDTVIHNSYIVSSQHFINLKPSP